MIAQGPVPSTQGYGARIKQAVMSVFQSSIMLINYLVAWTTGDCDLDELGVIGKAFGIFMVSIVDLLSNGISVDSSTRPRQGIYHSVNMVHNILNGPLTPDKKKSSPPPTSQPRYSPYRRFNNPAFRHSPLSHATPSSNLLDTEIDEL